LNPVPRRFEDLNEVIIDYDLAMGGERMPMPVPLHIRGEGWEDVQLMIQNPFGGGIDNPLFPRHIFNMDA
jgi:hypothetical protein